MTELHLPMVFNDTHGARAEFLGPALMWHFCRGMDPRNARNLLDGWEALAPSELAAMWTHQTTPDAPWTFDHTLGEVKTVAEGLTRVDGVWWMNEDNVQIWMSWTSRNWLLADRALPQIRFRVYYPDPEKGEDEWRRVWALEQETQIPVTHWVYRARRSCLDPHDVADTVEKEIVT